MAAQPLKLDKKDGSPPLVVVIAGPTAVGKSDVAMALAELVDQPAELISADSVQVYKRLDIGSNKPTPAEQERCPIRLVDWLEPTEQCTVMDWTKEAMRAVNELHGAGVLPIVVGGSSMYVDWLVHGERDAGKADPEVRAQVEETLRPFQEKADWNGAFALLADANPEKAKGILRNDWKLLSRGLELLQTPPVREGRASRSGLDMRGFFISPPERQVLYDRIDERCLAMLRVGIMEEVAGLLEEGLLDFDSSAALAIGYRQVMDYLTRPDPREGDVEAFAEFIRGFGQATRSYSQKQMVWFRKDESFRWVPSNRASPQSVAAEIARLCQLPREVFLQEAAGEGALRRPAGQEAFRSRLNQVEQLLGEEMQALLQVADACTRRVPAHLRRQEEPLETVELADGTNVGKVYWHGRHKDWGWMTPLGKVHRQGMEIFNALGWREIEVDNSSTLPVFCWPVKKASGYPAFAEAGEPLPLVRPFPMDFTERLDNKAMLAAHLAAAGHADAHPLTMTAEDFLSKGSAADEATQEVWFLKHSLGVKGNGVHAFPSRAALRQHLEEKSSKWLRGFVAQQGIAPPALMNGRKWVIRAHAVLHGKPQGALEAFCHKEMIVIQNGQVYSDDTAVRPAHISSAGRPEYWPKPTLLEDEELAEQVCTLAAKAFASVARHAPRGPYSPTSAELCQVFGLDVGLDANGRAWLMEVNDYPAIASGTMSKVDPVIYTELVRDVINLVAIPKLTGEPQSLGSFSKLSLDQWLPAEGQL